MFCQNCGKKLENGEKFCSNCGTPNTINFQIENENTVLPKRKKSILLLVGIISIIIIALIIIAVVILTKASKTTTYDEKMDLGRKYLAELDYDQAVLYYKEAINIDPKNTSAYIELADVYSKMGDNRMAREILAEAVKNSDDKKEKEKINEIMTKYEDSYSEALSNPTPTPETNELTPTPMTDKPTATPYADRPTATPYADKPTPTPYTDKPTPETEKPTPTPYAENPTPEAEKPVAVTRYHGDLTGHIRDISDKDVNGEYTITVDFSEQINCSKNELWDKSIGDSVRVNGHKGVITEILSDPSDWMYPFVFNLTEEHNVVNDDKYCVIIKFEEFDNYYDSSYDNTEEKIFGFVPDGQGKYWAYYGVEYGEVPEVMVPEEYLVEKHVALKISKKTKVKPAIVSYDFPQEYREKYTMDGIVYIENILGIRKTEEAQCITRIGSFREHYDETYKYYTNYLDEIIEYYMG